MRFSNRSLLHIHTIQHRLTPRSPAVHPHSAPFSCWAASVAQAGRPESCSRAPWLWLCSDSCVWINYWIQISKVVACARWAFGGGGTTGKQQLTWPQPPSVHSEVPRLFLLQWHDGTPRSKVNTEKKVYASLIFPPHASRCHSPLLLSSSLVLFSLLLCMYLTFLKNAC